MGPIQAPKNMTKNAGQNAAAGFQASFGNSGDNVSQAIMQMNSHLNDVKPFIDSKNVLIDALATQGNIDQKRLIGLNPNVRNAVINRDTNFILSNLKQVENVINGNNLEFQNAVGIITGGMDRKDREKEREFSQSIQLVKTQVDMLGSQAFEGMSPEQVEMIEKRLGISVGDMAKGLRGKEDEVRAEKQKEWDFKDKQFGLSEKQFQHSKNVDNQQLAISRGNLGVSQSRLANEINAAKTKGTDTWGSVDYQNVGGILRPDEAPRTKPVYFDPKGRESSMAEWVTNNYSGSQVLDVIQEELIKAGRFELADELVERKQWAVANNDAGQVPWFLSHGLSEFGF